MGEFDTYSLIDFMPMESEVYFRLFIRLNEAVWPLQWLTLALGGAAIGLGWRGSGRYLGAILGICWAWVGLIFHLRLFAELNWAAGYIGWGFVVQGILLLGLGFLGRLDHKPESQSSPVGYIGLGLAIFALVVYPLIIPLSGRSWSGVELFGTAPDPTAMATLGLLLLPRRVPWLLTAIPLLWCVFSGASWFALDWYPGLIVPVAALVFLALAAPKTSRR